jgi:hypothetical protein
MFKKRIKNESVVESLQRMSGGAINTVVNLINQLKSINESIDDEKATNVEKIKSIEADQISLDNLKASNEKIIGNFEGLLK